MGSILGGILGGGSSPGQAAQEQALRNATEAYREYRPEAMQARLNAMGTISNAYQGANNALETLWGNKPTKPDGLAPFRPGARPLKALPPPPSPMGEMAAQKPVGQSHHGGSGIDPLGRIFDPLNIFGGF